MKFPTKHGDFSALEELVKALESPQVVVAHGVYGDDDPEPGPHVSISSPTVKRSFDFIKRKDGSFILRVT